MTVEMKNLKNVVRVCIMTLTTLILLYIFSIYLNNVILFADITSIKFTVMLWIIYFCLLYFVGFSNVKTEDDLMLKYVDVKHVTRSDILVYFVCRFALLVLAFKFTCSPGDYSTYYVNNVNNVLVNAEFTPAMRILFCSLPAWYTTPTFSMYLDIDSLGKYLIPSVLCIVLYSIITLRSIRATVFQNKLLRLRKGADNGSN